EEASRDDEPPVLERADLDRVHDAPDQLSPMQRACFRLVIMEGFASAHVGAMLRRSVRLTRVPPHCCSRSDRASVPMRRRSPARSPPSALLSLIALREEAP